MGATRKETSMPLRSKKPRPCPPKILCLLSPSNNIFPVLPALGILQTIYLAGAPLSRASSFYYLGYAILTFPSTLSPLAVNLNFAEVRDLQESLRKSLKEAQVYKCSTRRRSRLIKAAFTYRRGGSSKTTRRGEDTPKAISYTL